MVRKDEFNSVGENSVQLFTNPCPPFMTLLMMEGCFTSTGGLMSLWLHPTIDDRFITQVKRLIPASAQICVDKYTGECNLS